MSLGNDEGVSLTQWSDIQKGQHVIVFMDFVAGDLTRDNLAEDAVGIGGQHGAYSVWIQSCDLVMTRVFEMPCKNKHAG